MVRTLTERARRVSGITLLALRASLRTKVVAALLVLLTACVLILPGIVKGDGTPEGDLLILLSYTLGFSFGILCLATLAQRFRARVEPGHRVEIECRLTLRPKGGLPMILEPRRP